MNHIYLNISLIIASNFPNDYIDAAGFNYCGSWNLLQIIRFTK